MKAVPAILISFALVVLYACSKDKFETKPRLEIKEYSTKDVALNGSLTITLHYYDKEGDLGNAQFFAQRVRINQLPLAGNDKADNFPSPLPDFSDRQDGEIIFSLDYNTLRETFSNVPENDSLVFRFAVTDRAGNASDTITSDVVVIHP